MPPHLLGGAAHQYEPRFPVPRQLPFNTRATATVSPAAPAGTVGAVVKFPRVATLGAVVMAAQLALVRAVRRDRQAPVPMSLVPGDPLAHRALDSLLRAEASVRRRLSADLEREGISASGFSVLVILTTAGGALELRALRARLRTSKANATEVVTTLETRGLVHRSRLAHDRRAAGVELTPRGREIVDRLFPEHTERVERAFSVLDEREKRSLAEICRKLAA